MQTDNSDIRAELDQLKAENERLRKQLAQTRADRKEAVDALCKFMPPPNLPSEEEMIEQLKYAVPAEQVIREMDEILKNGGK
ncbi:MAG TPA: hypothetical protein VHR66_09665 [Gemmataceae bacterium]|jgi:chromosome condensin MukBEF ATPase and DNA-binding subunit MukB|nr:hypothetical protein [Gemmataceae bacterium]